MVNLFADDDDDDDGDIFKQMSSSDAAAENAVSDTATKHKVMLCESQLSADVCF